MSMSIFSNAMPRLRKFVTAILLLLLILLILAFLLTGTNKGFQFLMVTVQEHSSGSFHFSTISGNLFDKIEVTGLQYSAPSFKLQVRHLQIDWQVDSLLNRNVTLDKVAASSITYTQLEVSPADQGNKPNAEPSVQATDILLPVNIFLKQMHLTDIRFIDAADLQTEHIDKIFLSAEMLQSQLNIHQLIINRQDKSLGPIEIKINGQTNLTGHYPLTLQTNISLDLTGLIPIPQSSEPKKLLLTGAVTGDLSQLQIKQKISGLANASIKAQANHLLGKIDWRADINISKIPLTLLSPEILASQSLPSEKKVGVPDRELSGQITISGDFNQASVLIKTRLSGSSKLFDNEELEIKGSVNWQAALQWQATLHAKKINPGIFQQEWPGALNIELLTSGQVAQDQYQFNIQLDKLDGNLREQPVKGHGQFYIDNNSIDIQQFSLSSGDAHLKANGKLGNADKDIDLNWSVNIKQLSDLLPETQGSIIGQGKISSPPINQHKNSPDNDNVLKPIINAQLKLDNIIYQTSHLGHADLKIAINSNPVKPSSIAINAQSLVINSQAIKQLKFNLNGPLENHQLKLSVKHDIASLLINAQGKFDTEQLNWQGQIKQTSIDGKTIGRWEQQTANKLLAGADKVVLAPLCLKKISISDKQAQQTSFCTRLDWTPEKGQANVTLNALSLAQFKAYIPDEISTLTGELNLKANIDLGPKLLADIKAEIKPGQLIFQPLAQKPITLLHRNGLILASYNHQQLESQWHIELGPHKLEGKISIPRKAFDRAPVNAPIDGKIKIDIKDLNLLSILLPQISGAKGHMLAQLDINGRLGTPKVSGQAHFIADYLTIHDAGIQIETINIKLQDKNNGQALDLLGSLHSGGGQLKLTGQVSLDAAQGWPVEINLKGDNFLAVNTPDIYAVISPHIHFRQEQSLMYLKGRVLVPEATISPSTIPEDSITVSSDIEILGAEKKSPANLDLNITLALGTANSKKEVKLDAFGLKSTMSGELTINQQPRQLMTAHGELHLNDGTFRAYGQDLNIDKGSIFYAGGYIDNPGIKLTASRQVNNTQVGIKVSGSANKPRVKTFSDAPGLESKDIISMMLTGQKTDNLENAKVYAGTEISENLSVGVNAGIGDDGSEFITRYKLTDKVQLEGTSSATKSGGNIIYTFEVE